ncbi:MAG: hypothetical protein EHM78_01920 [Myxococcaceae bacterium]|nr:MAG: hypothetical protein EHM78_01920 [Myxococcaceae bacterium]
MSFFIWSPNRALSQRQPDATRCRCAVRGVGSYFSHQCRNKVKVWRQYEGKRMGFCALHDPVKREALRATRAARWEAESKARDERDAYSDARRAWLLASVEVVRRIAAGANDARGLAGEHLAAEPKKPA